MHKHRDYLTKARQGVNGCREKLNVLESYMKEYEKGLNKCEEVLLFYVVISEKNMDQ